MTLTQIKKLANNQINTDLTKEQAKELNMQSMTYVYFENEYIVVCKKDGSVIIYESNGIDEDIEYINNCLVSLGYINANENTKTTTQDIFSSLKNTMHKVINTNQYYYFIGMLTMAKTTETITQDQYNYLLDEVNAKRTIKQ